MAGQLIHHLIIAIAGFIGLGLALRGSYPARLFWAIGLAAWAIASLLAALVAVGVDGLSGAQALVSRFAATGGAVAFLVAAIAGFAYRPLPEWGFWVGIAIVVLIGLAVLLQGSAIGRDGQLILYILVIAIGAWRYARFRQPAMYLIGGGVMFLLLLLLTAPLATALNLPVVLVHTTFLALGLLAFGVSASRS